MLYNVIYFVLLRVDRLNQPGPGMKGGATGGSGVRTDVSTDRKGSPGTPVAEKMA